MLPSLHTNTTLCNVHPLSLQLLFPVLGLDQEASPRGLRDSDSVITINVFDEVVTPTAALKAMRAVARASNSGEGMGGGVTAATEQERWRSVQGFLCVQLNHWIITDLQRSSPDCPGSLLNVQQVCRQKGRHVEALCCCCY